MLKELKGKDEEVADLQVQLQDFKKVVYDSGEKLLNKLEKSSRENNNLVEWLKLYDKKIKDYEKEIYNLNLRLYFSQQHQQINAAATTTATIIIATTTTATATIAITYI
ncbi:hypothetical protein RhiirA4_489681 [Rhizophagus irregularis]|uniref:Uncharacterized protein n=1 Tax=Rhizophagus irregularis TaxID=588596 RepID=A0A2I1HV28_9GLOM|nr:hypothetical protein RhiirA4_489681 [Rhizophagus irregularis]